MDNCSRPSSENHLTLESQLSYFSLRLSNDFLGLGNYFFKLVNWNIQLAYVNENTKLRFKLISINLLSNFTITYDMGELSKTLFHSLCGGQEIAALLRFCSWIFRCYAKNFRVLRELCKFACSVRLYLLVALKVQWKFHKENEKNSNPGWRYFLQNE